MVGLTVGVWEWEPWMRAWSVWNVWRLPRNPVSARRMRECVAHHGKEGTDAVVAVCRVL